MLKYKYVFSCASLRLLFSEFLENSFREKKNLDIRMQKKYAITQRNEIMYTKFLEMICNIAFCGSTRLCSRGAINYRSKFNCNHLRNHRDEYIRDLYLQLHHKCIVYPSRELTYVILGLVTCLFVISKHYQSSNHFRILAQNSISPQINVTIISIENYWHFRLILRFNKTILFKPN